MTRKPKVEAWPPNLPVWAWKVRGGTGLWHIGFGPAPSSDVDSVEYVPADPAKERVVRAAVKWASQPFRMNGGMDYDLAAAVEKLQKGRRK